MKISAFTFLRNGSELGYPYLESIRSMLPLCDEFVIACGRSNDDTLARLIALNEPKIRIIETEWNDNMQDRGYVYGQQKMIAQFNCTGDWAFYLEGDELLHENELDRIHASMKQHLSNRRVEALHFDFLHFHGSPHYLGIGGYRRAPRIIRNSLRSIAPDGLFFVVMDKNKRGRYPYAKSTGAHIYHYGHVRHPKYVNQKNQQVGRFWGNTQPDHFVGYGHLPPWEMQRYDGSHPALIQAWLTEHCDPNFAPAADYTPTLKDYKHLVKFKLEAWLNCDLRKKHYIDV